MSADEHFRLGQAYEAEGLADDAARQYENAVRLDRKNPEDLVALGNVAFKKGDFARAEEFFRRALGVSPEHAGAQNNLAMTYLAQTKNLAEAERLAKAALRRKGPLQPYALDTLAKIYFAEGRFPEARDAAQQAAESGLPPVPPPPE